MVISSARERGKIENMLVGDNAAKKAEPPERLLNKIKEKEVRNFT